jgi:hypothetical protein
LPPKKNKTLQELKPLLLKNPAQQSQSGTAGLCTFARAETYATSLAASISDRGETKRGRMSEGFADGIQIQNAGEVDSPVPRSARINMLALLAEP